VRFRCRCGEPTRSDGADTCLACELRRLGTQLPRSGRWRFETFPAETPEQADALRAVREWHASLDEGESNLYLHGPPGRGKSSLAWGCAFAEVETLGDAEFVNVRRWLREKRCAFEATRRAEIDPLADIELPKSSWPQLEKFDGLLTLDDLGAERPTAFALEEIAGLVESRYDRLGPNMTIVTSNFSPAALARRLGGRNDPIAGERIVQRLVQDALIVEVRGVNLRASHTSASAVRQIVEGGEAAEE
jgi:DNA replication protein DnaC